MKPYHQEAGVTIYHGDCRELLPELTADVVITDPPYGVGHKYEDSAGYTDTAEEWENLVLPAFDLMRKAAPLVLITTGFRHMWKFPQPTWALCWAKPGSTRKSGLAGFSEWEPVLVYGKRQIYNDFKLLPDCNNHSNGATGSHPCPKPIKLLTWLVQQASDPGATVLDPFMGSGTTLVAAKQLNRRSVGIELNERYCEIAAKRLGQEVLNLWAS